MPGTETRFITSFVRTLSRAERQVLMLYYVEELTLDEIGIVLNLSRSRAAAMLRSLQARARASLEAHQTVRV